MQEVSYPQDNPIYEWSAMNDHPQKYPNTLYFQGIHQKTL
jgi:hypothetical protein